MCKKFIITLFLALMMPFSVYAYSSQLIPGGENIGISLNSKGVLVVGTYDIDNQSPADEAGLKTGDIITSVNGKNIDTIDDMASRINEAHNLKVNMTYIRGSKEKNTTLKLYKDENNVYKTGLYVKDSIMGIGTLTFIDPKSKKFGTLGHEIIEQSTGKILEIKDGKIFDSKVTGVVPSADGNPGEKKADYDAESIRGIVSENTTQGIFGDYTSVLPDKKTYKVASLDDVKLGSAKIQTVLDGSEVSEYEIKITKINKENSQNKNFVFEITDEALLDKTNGIIQGMSGSPILQGDYIIGAVTHVVVNNPHKGYGIFIVNMLEEAEN